MLSTQEQREQAYLVRFGTRHPKMSHAWAWAQELFSEVRSLRFKTVRGRVFLLDGKDILGAGCDHVEAVASADITQKQLAAKKAQDKQPTTNRSTPPMDTPQTPVTTPAPAGQPDPIAVMKEAEIEIPALRAQVAKLNAALANLNQAAIAAPVTIDSPEMAAINAEAIVLNGLLGNPIPPVGGSVAIPPVAPAPTTTAGGLPTVTPASTTTPATNGIPSPSPAPDTTSSSTPPAGSVSTDTPPQGSSDPKVLTEQLGQA